MTLDAVVRRVADGGNLLANLALINPKTWQTSQEVFRDWNNGALVEGMNTANMGIYRIVNGEPVFDLLSREGNPFIDEKFRKDVYQYILDNIFFFPQTEMKKHIMTAIHAGASVTVHYSKLRVKTDGCSSNHGYVEVDGSNNDEENKLFKGVYGTENLGGKRVYILRKEVVGAQLHGDAAELIVRACYFLSNQYFLAIDRDFLKYFSAVRGAVQGEGAQHKSDVETPIPVPLKAVPLNHTSTDIIDIIAYLKTHPVTDERVACVLLSAANAFYQRKASQ